MKIVLLLLASTSFSFIAAMKNDKEETREPMFFPKLPDTETINNRLIDAGLGDFAKSLIIPELAFKQYRPLDLADILEKEFPTTDETTRYFLLKAIVGPQQKKTT